MYADEKKKTDSKVTATPGLLDGFLLEKVQTPAVVLMSVTVLQTTVQILCSSLYIHSVNEILSSKLFRSNLTELSHPRVCVLMNKP